MPCISSHSTNPFESSCTSTPKKATTTYTDEQCEQICLSNAAAKNKQIEENNPGCYAPTEEERAFFGAQSSIDCESLYQEQVSSFDKCMSSTPTIEIMASMFASDAKECWIKKHFRY